MWLIIRFQQFDFHVFLPGPGKTVYLAQRSQLKISDSMLKSFCVQQSGLPVMSFHISLTKLYIHVGFSSNLLVFIFISTFTSLGHLRNTGGLMLCESSQDSEAVDSSMQ